MQAARSSLLKEAPITESAQAARDAWRAVNEAIGGWETETAMESDDGSLRLRLPASCLMCPRPTPEEGRRARDTL